MRRLLMTASLLACRFCAAEPGLPPQLGEEGMAAFRAFAEAPEHRAFAVAPGGAWGWVAGAADSETAEAGALDATEHRSEVEIPATGHEVLFVAVAPAVGQPDLADP